MKPGEVLIEMVGGVEGPSLYIDQLRICGNKPWGGGRLLQKWVARKQDIQEALDQSVAKEPKEADHD